MTQPLGVDDFFTLEAGEYLDRLGSLAATPGLPNGDELVRFTRALRGSALMANQQAIARAASGLEHLVRSYRDGRRPWDADLSAVAREAVDVLRTLVERVRIWSAEDAARAERLALHLEKAAGGVPRPITTPTPSASETGVRAFLARESAALGSVLDQAARGLKSGSVSVDALQGVFRRMQPLRGLAALTDYPPLPDLLDGIERTVNAVAQLELPAKHGSERLDAAAAALSRAARDIADRGRPDIEGEEFRRFAGFLLEPEAEEPAVLEIDALFFPGEDGVVQRGVVPRTPSAASLGAAPVVSRGEHLCQAADEILEATSTSQRDLRLHHLLRDLRTLGPGMPDGLDVAVEAFAVAARAAVSRGVAAEDPTRFAAVIREAGTRLRGYSEVTQPTTLLHVFRELVAQMEELRPVPTRPTPAVTASPLQPAAVPARPIATQPETEIVPIEALAPEETPAEIIVPIEALAPSEPAALVSAGTGLEWDLASSYSSYEALVRGAAKLAAAQAARKVPVTVPTPALAPVAARPPLAPPPPVKAPPPVAAPTPPAVRPPVVVPAPVVAPPPAAAPTPIAARAPAAPPIPVAVAPPVEAIEQPVVDISELLYHGRSALLRADQIRVVLRAAVARTDSVKAIRPLVDELLDLVELAIAD